MTRVNTAGLIHGEKFKAIYSHEVKITTEIKRFVEGEFVNEYKMIEKIGEGRFGKVYKVAQSEEDMNSKMMAMKVIKKTSLKPG
jgi:serine/threonine protein kinase